MVSAGKRCLKLHQITFTILGLWPYERSFIWRLQTVVFFGIYFFTVVFQLAIFLTTMNCNMDCLLKRVCYIFTSFVDILNYYSFYFNSTALKQIMEHIQLDWKMFENTDAIKIFEEYLLESYIFAIFAYLSVFMGVSVFAIIESRPTILDIIMPLNESRPRKVEIDFECFLNTEKYFFLYVVQEIMSVFLGFCSIVTTGTFLITLGKHCCATYKIASYLMQNTVTVYTLQLPASERMQFMHQNICLSIHIHRRTMEFINAMILSFDMWYFPLVLIGVLSLSCVMFRLYNAIIQFNDYYDIFLSSVILSLYLAYMLVGNILGQSYLDHSAELLESIYNTLWYTAPLPIQKLFLIVQKSMRGHKLILGGLFVPSIEGLSTLMTSALSYFTVIHAMR